MEQIEFKELSNADLYRLLRLAISELIARSDGGDETRQLGEALAILSSASFGRRLGEKRDELKGVPQYEPIPPYDAGGIPGA